VNNTNEKIFIDGERIYLRRVMVSDVDTNYHRWMNDPEVTSYLESRFLSNGLESLRSYVEAMAKDRDNLFLGIILKEQDRHIGNIKLGPINWIHRYGDIGIIVGEKDCWGKGYAAEAIGLLSRYAFDVMNLNKLTAGCYGKNIGSVKTFQKAGFSVEGVREQQYICDGTYIDAVMMGMVRTERKENG